MSQAGGPNSAGSVNIDFTGNVAPLEQAAKKAEQTVQQAATTMKAATVEAAQAATAAAGAAGGVGPSAGFGVFGGSAAGGSAASASSGGRFSGLINGAKSAMVPLNGLFAILGRVNAVIALVSAGGYGLYRAFTASARAAAESKKELEGLSKSLDGLYSQFKVNLDKSPAQIEAEGLVKVEEERAKADAEAYRSYKDGKLQLKDLVAFRIQNEEAAEKAAANVRRNFQLAKNKEETDSLIATGKASEQAARAREDLQAKMAGGYAEVYLNAENEIRRAGETLSGESLDVRIANIEFERNEKIRIMGEAEKKIADDAIEQAKRVNAEKIRLMNDFYRQQREAQAESTRVESFFAGNQGQSFSLANRQRTAIEGQLPSVNYQGAD